jgi:hypothetical protein
MCHAESVEILDVTALTAALRTSRGMVCCFHTNCIRTAVSNIQTCTVCLQLSSYSVVLIDSPIRNLSRSRCVAASIRLSAPPWPVAGSHRNSISFRWKWQLILAELWNVGQGFEPHPLMKYFGSAVPLPLLLRHYVFRIKFHPRCIYIYN